MLRKILFQDNIKNIIFNALSNDKLSHSILLCGEEGCGKTTLALQIAALERCTAVKKPCFECDECFKVSTLSHSGLIFLDTDNLSDRIMSIEKIYTANSTNFHVVSELAFLVSDILNRVQNGYLSIKSQSSKKNKSIDAESLHDFKDKQRRKRLKNEDIVSALDTCVSISSLINNNNIPASTAKAIMKKLYQSNFSGRKTVIITGIDKMRAEGANAFLKTLEEPPGDTRIILITSKPDDVLPTIKSRCNIFHLKSLNSEEKRLIIKENWDIDVSDNIFDGSLLKIAASLKENAAEDIYNSLINGITLNLGEAASKLSQSDNLEEHIRSLLDLTNKKLKNQPDQLIELSRQADRAIFYINKNNADKLMTVESLLLSFYGAWRKALT